MSRTGALAPLREASFRWYFLSRLVNLCGTTMAPVALAFGVLEVSHSPGDLGLVLAAHSLPMVVFILAGGVIADRLGRTLVIQGANVLSALSQGTIAVLLITDRAEIWHFVVLSALNGVASAASMPALAGLVPQLVPRAQLQPANVLVSMARSALSILGPSLAAVLVVSVGPGWALAVDALTWAASALLLGLVDIPARPRTGEEPSVLAELREGWAYVRSTTWLWVVVVTFAVLNAIHEGGLNTLGPVLAKDSAIGEGGWGLIMSAQAVGLLLMGVVLMRVTLQRPLLWGMLGVALFGLPMVVLGAVAQTPPVLVAAVLAGMGIELFGLGWNLAMQEHVPDEMLSRAYSYDMLGSFVAMPLGPVLVGPLAAVFGVREVLVAGGVVYLVLSLAVLGSRSVRTLPRVVTAQPLSTSAGPGPR